jgi:hypothetical protein
MYHIAHQSGQYCRRWHLIQNASEPTIASVYVLQAHVCAAGVCADGAIERADWVSRPSTLTRVERKHVKEIER